MTEPDGPGPTATSDALAGTEWVIVRLADEPVVDGRRRRWCSPSATTGGSRAPPG